MAERLQKVISRAGVASRREAEKMILEGRVTVNKKVVTELGTKVEAGKDKVRVDGRPVYREETAYILLNKPKGVITSVKDDKGRQTVVDLLDGLKERVYPVGRLDYHTEGVLLLTNDGELANGLIHPRYHVEKTYVAKVRGIPSEEELDQLRIGVKLADGAAAPAKVVLLDADEAKGTAVLELVIHEGRNRQVRRMCEAIGYPVRNLKRTKFAFLTAENLRRGQYRPLEDAEVARLKRLASAEAAARE